MSGMVTIQAQPLTPQAFAPFGTYVDLLHAGFENGQEVMQSSFFPDLMPLTVAQPTSVSMGRVCSCRKIIPFLERHPGTAEVRLPLDGSVVIYAAPQQSLETFDLSTLRAFIVPRGTMIELAPGVVHGRQFTVDQPVVHMLFLCRHGPCANDVELRRLGSELEIEIDTEKGR